MFDGNPVPPDKAPDESFDFDSSMLRDIYTTTYFDVLSHLLGAACSTPSEAVDTALAMARKAANATKGVITSLK